MANVNLLVLMTSGPEGNKRLLFWTGTCKSSLVDDFEKHSDEEAAAFQSWYFTGATAEAFKCLSETIIVTHDCPHKSLFTFYQTLGSHPCPFSEWVCHWDFTKLFMDLHEAKYESLFFFQCKEVWLVRHFKFGLNTVLIHYYCASYHIALSLSL